MKKLLIIINPAAGRGGFKSFFGEAMQVLGAGGMQPSLFFTGKRGDATVFAAEHALEYDVVACIGGDGTLSEVLAGLMQVKNPPPVGYFPMGTANDVATTLGLPKNDTVGAAKRILTGTPHPFDVGGFGNSEYFAYIAAFGAFTEVSYSTPQDQKKALGHLAYVLQGAATLGKIETIHTRVEYDDGVFEDELVLVRNPVTLDAYAELTSSVLSRRFDSDALVILHTRHAKFTFDKPIAWTRDGEAGGEHRVIELCNYHAPVQLIF